MFAALRTLRRDLQAVRERDPANRGRLESILCYPGIHAVWGYRASRWLWGRRLELPARVLSTLTRWLTGADIHPAAALGPGLFIDHAMGVVIGQTAEVGSDVTIYQGVTLGGTSLAQGKRHPTVGDRVTIGAGAKILGAITIGEGSRIGANAVVVKPVPPNSVVVGVPGQVISRSRPRPTATWAAARPRGDTSESTHRVPSPGSPATFPSAAGADLDNSVLPDVVGAALAALLARVGKLEEKVNGHRTPTGLGPSEAGVWRGEDFSI